jgi:hypothetical protein
MTTADNKRQRSPRNWPTELTSTDQGPKHKAWQMAGEGILLATLLIMFEVGIMNIYVRLHGSNLHDVLFEGNPIPKWEFVSSDRMLGITIEAIAWAGTAVVVRRLVRLARNARAGKISIFQDLLGGVADYTESIFLTVMVLFLLGLPKLTLGTGVNVSLNDANIDMIIALCCILGWFVGRTRGTLTSFTRNMLGDHVNRDKQEA